MKKEDLFEAIGNIDDQLLMASEQKLRSFRLKHVLIPITLAGCAAALIFAFAAIKPKDKPVIQVDPSLEAEEPLPTFEMSFGAGGMGFEGYIVKSIEDFKGVDWLTEDLEIETVPVYQNVEFLHEGISTVLNPDLDRMKAIIDDLAQRLNVDYEELVAREDNGIIYAYEVSNSKISIEVNSLMEAEINFKEELVLPENIHNGYDDSYEEIAAYGEYCMDEFSYLWDEELELVVSGGDYNIYDEQSFDAGAQNDKMKVSFCGSDTGDTIWLMRIFYLMKYEKIGDYPIIDLEEATSLLLGGQFVSSAPDPELTEENIYGVTFEYRDSIYDQTIMPYYVFYMEIDSETQAEDDYLHISRYYVPAIPKEYISNWQTWMGQFN